jgi:hypothetical protein
MEIKKKNKKMKESTKTIINKEKMSYKRQGNHNNKDIGENFLH